MCDQNGITFPLCATSGPASFPAILQDNNETEFGSLRDLNSTESDRKVCVTALDDLKMSDGTFPEHVKHVNMVLDRATDIGAEFSIEKNVWATAEVEYWGFLLS